MLTRFAKLAPLGTVAAIALTLAPQSASALNLTFNGPAISTFITVDTSEKPGDTLAGAFQMQGDEAPFLAEFFAWCFEIGPSLNTDSAEAYDVEDFLSTGALARVQKVFDANYHDATIRTTQPKAAAFQLAIWEAIYETTDTTLSLSAGAFTSASPLASAGNVREFADTYLANANGYTGDQKWIITQFKSDDAQNLGTAVIPLPAAAWLLLGVSGALVAAKRRSSARKAA
jgi:hypothetical protein